MGGGSRTVIVQPSNKEYKATIPQNTIGVREKVAQVVGNFNGAAVCMYRDSTGRVESTVVIAGRACAVLRDLDPRIEDRQPDLLLLRRSERCRPA